MCLHPHLLLFRDGGRQITPFISPSFSVLEIIVVVAYILDFYARTTPIKYQAARKPGELPCS